MFSCQVQFDSNGPTPHQFCLCCLLHKDIKSNIEAAFSTNDMMPLVMLLAALHASVTENPDNLPVKETRFLKEARFCCGIRTEEAVEYQNILQKQPRAPTYETRMHALEGTDLAVQSQLPFSHSYMIFFLQLYSWLTLRPDTAGRKISSVPS